MSKKIIASLTTYGTRIFTVHLTIKTILNQTKKADAIILWLAEDEFNLDNIPRTLQDMKKLGIEIGFCKDIKSYKKLIPTLKKYPNDIIITFDDDAYYKKDVIEKLVMSYDKYPKSIHCLRGHKIIFDENMMPVSYNQWESFTQDFIPGYDIFPTGLGGVLYPPNCFYKDIVKEELFMKLAPQGDDIWFKIMGLLNGYTSRVVEQENNFYAKVTLIEGTQDTALWNKNKNEESGNNLQLKNICDYYKKSFNFKNLFSEKDSIETYFFNEIPKQISVVNEFNNSCVLKISKQALLAIFQGKLKLRILNIGSKDIINNCNIFIKSIAGNINLSVGEDNVTVVFEENSKGNYNFMLWKNSKVVIGKNTTSNGIKVICDNSEFICGNDCMFSSDILIQSSDQHGIVDISNKVIINNIYKSVILGDHVWLGRQSCLLPNAKIGDGSIIGANSMVTKEIPKKVIAVGIPARVTKENMTWSRTREELDSFSQHYITEYENNN